MTSLYKTIFCVVCGWGVVANATALDGAYEEPPLIPFTLDYGGQGDLSGSLNRSYYTSRHGALSRYNGTPITKFSLQQDFSGTVLHYSRTQSDREKQQFVGLVLGKATLAYFDGRGESFLKSGNRLYPDLNHYFAHGGTRSKFGFQGAGVDYGFSEGLNAQFVGVRVTSAEVDVRTAYYAGVSGDWFDAGFFRMERDNDAAGNGFRISLSGQRVGVDIHQIRTTTDAQVRHLGLSFTGNSVSSFSMGYEDARNPLYSEGDERRVMLRYRRMLGGSRVAFNASEGEKPKSKKKGINAIAGVGAGLGAAALFASSGDKSNDDSGRFSSDNDAGITALNQINPTSVAENREYGGWVYRNADGSFGFTTPVQGDVASVNIGSPASVPGGTVASASYHTHGGADPRYVNNEFSPQDLASDASVGVNGYLGTPQSCGAEDNSSGCAKKHIVATGAVIVLGPIAN